MMIDQITVDKILEAAQIVDVVSEFVNLKRRGVNFVGLCPFHSDKTPSFYVSPAKNICKCFACGEGGTAVHFIMKHEQLSYYEALKFLAKKYNIEIQEKALTDEQQRAFNERESLFLVNDFARKHFMNMLHEHPEGKTIGLGYLSERGFSHDIIQKFQLGYSLEHRTSLLEAADQSGFKHEYLLKTGLMVESERSGLIDRFRGRVMFPVHTLSGKVVAFGGRILKKVENTGKYINSPESEIYHKSDQLYGIYFAKQAIAKQDKCYLVEGYTDVISLHQSGIENVVSSSGTALTQGQIKMIHRFTSNITVLYDGDAAGIKAALRGIDLLLAEGLNIKVVRLPEGEDPDSFSKKHNPTVLQAFLRDNETDFIRFKTALLLKEMGNDPIQRASLISDIVKSISLIPDAIVRSVYTKECSTLLDISEQILVSSINKQRFKNSSSPHSSIPATHVAVSSRNTVESVGLLGEKLPHDIQGEEKQDNPLYIFELNVIYYMVRYGKHLLYAEAEEEETPPCVIDYIHFDLSRDDVHIQTPILKKIYDEAVTLLASDENFIPDKYFLAHTDSAISKLAAEVVSDRYQLSKIHLKQYGENVRREETPLAEEQQLFIRVPRVVTELKNAHISIKIKDLKIKIQAAQDNNDIDEAIRLMQEVKQLDAIKRELAKFLGERIVLKV